MTGVIGATVVVMAAVVARAESTATRAGEEATRQASDGRRMARKNGGNGVMELEKPAGAKGKL